MLVKTKCSGETNCSMHATRYVTRGLLRQPNISSRYILLCSGASTSHDIAIVINFSHANEICVYPKCGVKGISLSTSLGRFCVRCGLSLGASTLGSLIGATRVGQGVAYLTMFSSVFVCMMINTWLTNCETTPIFCAEPWLKESVPVLC